MISIFAIFGKKGLRPKWTIYKHVPDQSKKCLTVVNSVCHRSMSSSSSSVCVLAPAYTSLCTGLEYLLKAGYIILVNPNGAGFLNFWAGQQHCRMSGKCIKK